MQTNGGTRGANDFLIVLRSDSIYFDGFLPQSKLEVRVARMTRITSQLLSFYRSNPHGLPHPVSQRHDISTGIELFKLNCKNSDWPLDPCFLVPAIIDALRETEAYRAKARLVPSEADGTCAAAVRCKGGIVLSSDSDLLVHDLGCGRVAFFRDMQQDHECKIVYLAFAPQKVLNDAGLPHPGKIVHLAYERTRSPQSSFAQLLKRCARTVPQSRDYEKFQQQYTEGSDFPFSIAFQSSTLQSLDPRISEVILDFSSRERFASQHLPIRMFLPQLIEHPERKSAWDRSSFVRQVAYIMLNTCASTQHLIKAVHEFRRVQKSSQAGRLVEMITQDLAAQYINEILSCAAAIGDNPPRHKTLFWIFLAIAIDELESRRRGDASILQMLGEHIMDCRTNHDEPAIAWNMIHSTACIHGILYSFRIVRQVLSSVCSDRLHERLPNTDSLTKLFSQLIPLHAYPQSIEVVRLAHDLQKLGLNQVIDAVVGKSLRDDEDEDPFHTGVNHNITPVQMSPPGHTSRNMFAYLSIE